MNDQIEEKLSNVKRDNADKIKMDFFADSDRKAKLKNINRQVEEIMNKRNVQLFERRKK